MSDPRRTSKKSPDDIKKKKNVYSLRFTCIQNFKKITLIIQAELSKTKYGKHKYHYLYVPLFRYIHCTFMCQNCLSLQFACNTIYYA